MICKAWNEGEKHIQSLIEQYGLCRRECKREYGYLNVRGVPIIRTGFEAAPEIHSVYLKEIESEEEYWGALHEIGHCVDDRASTIFMQERNSAPKFKSVFGFSHDLILDVEASAWRWAIENSIYELNSRVVERIAMCLAQYQDCKQYFSTKRQHKIESDLLWSMLNY